MRSVDEAEAQRRFDQVVEDAGIEPLIIGKQGRDIAVVLSMAQTIGFLDLRNAHAKEASEAGLTADRLADLLDSD